MAYWMKLYIEILDDPKMATLPDRAWRRTIELFLVAKKLNNDGHLPDTRQIAWLLRTSADELEHDLVQIASTGIIEQEVGGWFIPKFSQRQSAVPDVKRKSQQRDREKSQQYYGDVTDSSRNVTQSRSRLTEADTEADTEAEAELRSSAENLDPFDAMQKMVEKVTGYPATPRDVEAIGDLVNHQVTEADLLAGVAFLKSVGMTPRGAANLRGSAITAKGKRTAAKVAVKTQETPYQELKRMMAEDAP